MRRITHALAAVATLAALAPLGGAQAEDPFMCNGSPEIPASYVCIVRFQVGADPVVEQEKIIVSPQTHTVGGGTVVVPSQTVNRPAENYTVPSVCAANICVGPLTVTTPPVNASTPGYSLPVPSQSVTTPGVSQTYSTVGLSIPPGAVLVLYYNGSCHYIWPDGSASRTSASAPNLCP